jgi:protein fantom
MLSDEALRIMNEREPSTFCTIEFFEHELQTTPIAKGQRADYNFTSQYIIRVDDFFLHYLQKKTTTIELYQTIGSDYDAQAACQLSFRELIDQQKPRLHGAANLLCVKGNNIGVSFGTLEYWARLIVPVDEAFRLYKERTKALGYLSANAKAAAAVGDEKNQTTEATVKAKSADNMNELNINILRCVKINSLNGKLPQQQQPSPYCVYKFYDFKDHDTEIIASSNYPEFNDHKAYAVPMDIDIDNYLKKECLDIYVFDDNEPENAGNYLGVAKIPLIGLAHDKNIKGTFELKKVRICFFLNSI